MPLINLLFDRPKKTKINTVDSASGDERELLILDATMVINHQHQADPTENPIEEGVVVSDHVHVKPKIVSLEGIVSEAPITIAQAVVGNVAGAIGAVTGIKGGLQGTLFTGALASIGGLLLNSQNNRVQDGFNALQLIQEKSIPVTLITGLRAYTNMILSSFNPVETPRVGGSLSFSATFKEIRQVKSEIVALPARQLDPSVQGSASSVQNTGKQQAKDSNGLGQSLASRLSGIGA